MHRPVTSRRRLRVALGSRGYPIVVGPAGAALVAAELARLARPLCVITDANVRRLVWPGIAAALGRAGVAPASPLVVPPGERSKRLEVLGRLLAAMLRRGLDRRTCVVALGGGVVGDLAGFVAATYLRGVDWVAVPTTLLAMVDAAVGGKVGVDHAGLKNVVGAFHQPRAVLIGTDFLATLPERERRNGLAEVVKYGMIADAALLRRLEAESESWLRPRASEDARLVTRCCRIKARLVASDEREAGPRAALNFGHTVGHALEADARLGLLHGEAVGLGMLVACRLASDLGVATHSAGVRLERLLVRLGLPTRLGRHPDLRALRRAWRRDKKARAGAPRFVLTPRVGAATVGERVPEERVVRALRVLFENHPTASPRLSSSRVAAHRGRT